MRSNGLGREAEAARLASIQAALKAEGLGAAAGLAQVALADGIDHPMLLSLLAAHREAEGRFDEALALLRRAAALAPDAVHVRNGIGLYLARAGRFEEAIAEYDRALAVDPLYARALANRGAALAAVSRLREAGLDFEAAAAADPGNPTAANGLAWLALRRGEPGTACRLARQVLERRPGFPGAALVLAEADIAEGRPQDAQAELARLAGDDRIGPLDRASAFGLLGDALDAQQRFAEAFAAWQRSGDLLGQHYRADHGSRPASDALVRALTARLEGRQIDRPRGDSRAARTHVFLLGFPRSGTTLIEQMLEEHPDIETMAEKECLVDAARDWMGDPDRFSAWLEAPDDVLQPYREAYWRRVAEEGAGGDSRVFVDKHPFNTFRLPLIARLFPDAKILFARRDPRDVVLSCFRHRFRMSDPVYQMLTLDGAARLYDAAMAMAEASATAFRLDRHVISLEAMIADFEGETRRICGCLGVSWTAALGDFAGNVAGRAVATPSGAQLVHGLNARGVGKWRDYDLQMAPVLPLLTAWVDRFGYR